MDGQTIPETLTKPRYLNFSSFSCFEKEDILSNEKFKKQLIFRGQSCHKNVYPEAFHFITSQR